MNWKLKKMLTDSFDRPFLQFFDEQNEEFKPQKEIATEETLRKISLSNSNDDEPPHLKNVEIIDNNIQPSWFHDGYFYGQRFATGEIHRSENGRDWELHKTLDVPNANIKKLIISDTGRFVVGMSIGDVYVSDEDGNFGSEPTLTTGRLSHKYGHFKYGHIIGFTTYETHGFDDGQLHEAFLSTDNGATFKKVYGHETLDTLEPLDDPSVYHIHDMEYDPYSHRLYLWEGDFNNRNLNVSDDWGESWYSPFSRGTLNNATQVIATPEGIVLGADTRPGGVSFITVDRSKNIKPEIKPENYEHLFWSFSEPHKRFIMGKRWLDREKDIYLMPFVSEEDDEFGGLVFSKDGYNWHMIYRYDDIGFNKGLTSVTYGNGVVAGVVQTERTGNNDQMFVADIDLN